MPKSLDITGRRFSLLTAIKCLRSVPRKGRLWLCKCDCGNYREVLTSSLTGGSTRMCKQCARLSNSTRCKKQNEKLREKRRDKLYVVWYNMTQRCYNKKHKSYSHYGKRGIGVCKDWLNDCGKFKKWALLNGYKEGLTLERINVNLGYSPENCRFVTMREQSYNRTNSKHITFEGIDIPTGLLAYELGIYNVHFHNVLSYCKNKMQEIKK